MPTIHRAHGSRFGSFDHPDRYDRWASRFFGGLYERVAADVAAAGLPDGARVLDVGTGPGRVPLAIARALPGLRVEGLDLSTEMVAQARRNATDAGLDDAVRFTVGDVADLPYADATFDLVVSTMSQHHWADAAAGLRELRRVLRPGAQVWIYDVRFALGGPPWSLLSAVSWVAEDRPGLGVTDRTQAALWASRHGLADDSD